MSDAEMASSETRIPPRVQAAQSYLHHAHRICEPAMYGVGDVPLAGRALSMREQATYEAALNVLLMYFHGEMDFGDAAPRRASDDGDGPRPMSPIVA